jgi:hypothetical protein
MADELLIEFGTSEKLLVLEFRRQINTIILTDIPDCFRWKLTGMRANTQCFEDMTTSREVAAECIAMYAGKSGQSTLANEFVFVV